jgi:UDP-glucose 4-epimerase
MCPHCDCPRCPHGALTGVVPPSALIIGSTGFIGRAIQAHLAARGLEVDGFSSATLDLRHAADLVRLDAYIRPSTGLIVTAVRAPGSGMSPHALAENVAMMANLATYLETRPAAACVYLSSDAVYPMIDEHVTEATRTDLSAFYALSKYAGERLLQRAAEKSGTPLLVLRPTAVYGPGDTHNAYGPNRFVRSIVRDRCVRLFGEGEETRDHISIDDFVCVVGELIARRESGLFNVATGTSHSFLAVAEMLRDIVPYDFEIVRTPRQTPVTGRRFDVSHLRSALPAFQFTPLRVGLSRTFAAVSEAEARV